MRSSQSTITGLVCSVCGSEYDAAQVQSVCTRCGKALLARYDLDKARRLLARETLKERPRSLWRYREVLPVQDDRHIISLGEGYTPLLRLNRTASELGLGELWMKDEAWNATGSFKARGLCMAVSKAKELGIREVCLPSAGNAGGAAAAYAAAGGLQSHIYMPEDTPRDNIEECRAFGADVHLVPGVISDAGKLMASERREWFDVSTLKEPYRVEGKKTMGYEIAEQFHWRLPDVIVYPTGGGTGLIGMWKAFDEMEELGWIGAQRPQMVAVQSAGCAPIVRAFRTGARESSFWENASTCASGLRVPKAFADHLILDSLYASGGTAIEVTDEEILATIKTAACTEGVLLSPEGAACIAGICARVATDPSWKSTSVLFFNTASAYKYAEVLARIAPA